MRHTPLVVGEETAAFALGLGELGPETALGVVLMLGVAMAYNPIALHLARAIAAHGSQVVVVDPPGMGANAHLDPTTATKAALLDEVCSSLSEDGVRRLALVCDAGSLQAALRVALDRGDVERVVSAGIPLPDRSRRLAQDVGAGEYLRRSLRLSALSGLADAEKRRRYLGMVRAKLAVTLGRRAGPNAEGTLAQLENDPSIAAIMENLRRGRAVTLLIGRDDRSARNIRELLAVMDLAPDQNLLGHLDVDMSFVGKVGPFDTLAAQRWFTDRVLDRLSRAPAAGT